jgi:hypothetical protein
LKEKIIPGDIVYYILKKIVINLNYSEINFAFFLLQSAEK